MNTIVTFVDGSQYTESVLDTAAWAAGRSGAGIDVVHVIGRRDTQTPVDFSGNLALGARTQLLEDLARHDEERARLANERGRLIVDAGVAHLKQAGVEQARARLRRGDVVEAVEQMDASTELVVIGKRGEAADFAKMHLGSNLERVARVSKTPVLVAARAFKPVESVLVAYDGGPSADKAVDAVARDPLFAELDIHLVMAGADTAQKRARLDAAKGKLETGGRTTTASLISGEPEAVITDYVKAHDIGLLVMGAYGHGRIRALIIGSTTTEMIRSVLIPVMLFR